MSLIKVLNIVGALVTFLLYIMSNKLTPFQTYLAAIELRDTADSNWKTYALEESRRSTYFDDRVDFYKCTGINKRVD